MTEPEYEADRIVEYAKSLGIDAFVEFDDTFWPHAWANVPWYDRPVKLTDLMDAEWMGRELSYRKVTA